MTILVEDFVRVFTFVLLPETASKEISLKYLWPWIRVRMEAFFFSHSAFRILVPHQRSKLRPLQWMLRPLINEPPGKPQNGAFHKNKTQSFQTRPRISIWSAGSWTLRLHPCLDPLVFFLCFSTCEQILPIRSSITAESAINNVYLKKEWAIISMSNI